MKQIKNKNKKALEVYKKIEQRKAAEKQKVSYLSILGFIMAIRLNCDMGRVWCLEMEMMKRLCH